MTNGRANDVSGNGNNGSLINIATSTFYTQGKIGQGLKFDGVNDYVHIPNSSSINVTGTISVSYWIYPKEDVASSDYIIYKVSNGGYSSSTYANYPYFYVYDSGGVSCSAYKYTKLGINKWRHIVGVYDGTMTLLYVDTSLWDTTDCGALVFAPTDIDLEIGPTASGNTLSASLDDVRVYNRALSATEITSLYNLGSAKFNVSPTTSLTSGLVGYWTFDGKDTPWTSATAATTLDKSGNGNTGTLTNMAQATSPAPGKIGQGLKFDGVNDYVKNTISTGIPIYSQTNPYSIAFWINCPPNQTVNTMFYGEGNTGNDNQVFGVIAPGVANGGSKLSMFIRNSAGANAFPNRPTNKIVCDNKWHHFTFTDNAGTFYYYVDGALDSQSGTYTPSGTLSPNTSAVGAVIRSTPTLYAKALMDDVRIYNRTLSATEITQLYNLGR
jgi:hypothetical protein